MLILKSLFFLMTSTASDRKSVDSFSSCLVQPQTIRLLCIPQSPNTEQISAQSDPQYLYRQRLNLGELQLNPCYGSGMYKSGPSCMTVTSNWVFLSTQHSCSTKPCCQQLLSGYLLMESQVLFPISALTGIWRLPQCVLMQGEYDKNEEGQTARSTTM